MRFIKHKKKLFLLFVLWCCTTVSFTNSVQNFERTVIFIDVSNSMVDVFPVVQSYIINDLLSQLPQNTSLTIFKFYGKLVKIYDDKFNASKVADVSKIINDLQSKYSWTDINNVFNYISENHSVATKVFIFSDGMHETKSEKSFVLTDDNIKKSIPDVVLTKDNAIPDFMYTVIS